MSATFQDLQQLENPRNDTVMSGASSVRDLFSSLDQREPFIFELRGERWTLTIGFSITLGFVQCSATNGSPPYLVAVPETPDPVKPLKFLAGGQQTEIAGRFCLPIERIEEIASEFIATGERSQLIAWDEV